MKAFVPLTLALTAALLLAACAGEDGQWRHHRDRDHDGDRHGDHLVGALTPPAVPLVARG